MFRALIDALDRQNPGLLVHVRYYLERHIGVDEKEHTPLALGMLEELCGDDTLEWREASRAVDVSIAARIALWDGILARVLRGSGVRRVDPAIQSYGRQRVS